jgi:hypothetical protein
MRLRSRESGQWSGGRPSSTATSRSATEVEQHQPVVPANRITPHLTGRCRVSLFPLDRTAQWLVVARPSPGWPEPAEKEARYLAETQHEVVVETSQLVFLRRKDRL